MIEIHYYDKEKKMLCCDTHEGDDLRLDLNAFESQMYLRNKGNIRLALKAIEEYREYERLQKEEYAYYGREKKRNRYTRTREKPLKMWSVNEDNYD